MSFEPARPRALTGDQQPFRGSEVVAAGLLTTKQLHSSAWRRLVRDVYVDARVEDNHLQRVVGAGLILPPGAAIAGRSAAILFGACEVRPLVHVEVVAPTFFGPIAGLAIHTNRLGPEEFITFRGMPVTTAVHAAWEIARSQPLLDAVPWIDSLARARKLSTADLILHAQLHRRVRGCLHADKTLERCDPRAESPPESVLRVEFHAAGIPVVPQYWVLVDGQFVARVDLALPEIRLAIEYDGQWHGDPHQLGRDRARVRLLNAANWHVFQVTKEDMHNIPQLVHSIRKVIRRLS